MRLRGLMVIFLSVIFSTSVFADSNPVNRQTAFNNTTDFLATAGKSAKDKKIIRRKRRDLRREARLKSIRQHKRAEKRKRMKQQEQYDAYISRNQ